MIIHVDMDAFYASVEIREQPELATFPVVVGGREGRGVVAAANYHARKFGVHSAMPIAEAIRRCKNLVCLPVRMPLYVEASQKINRVFYRYTPEIEPLSLDEAFLDVTASEHLFKSAENIGQLIKRDILKETKLVCSVGIANNKYVAKIASDINKPDGFVYVSQNKQQQFLDPLPVSRLWGAGKVTQAKFSQYGIQTIGDVRSQSAVFMQSVFGNVGQHFLNLANGQDSRRVSSERKTKSISHETTFEKDVDDMSVLRSYLIDLCEQVAARLRVKQFHAKTINIKLRYPDFKTITRSVSLDHPDNSTDVLLERAVGLFTKTMQQNKSAIRLIGVGVSGLVRMEQQIEDTKDLLLSSQKKQIDMFETQNDTAVLNKQKNIDKIADEVNQRFGKKTVQRGRSYHK